MLIFFLKYFRETKFFFQYHRSNISPDTQNIYILCVNENICITIIGSKPLLVDY